MLYFGDFKTILTGCLFGLLRSIYCAAFEDIFEGLSPTKRSRN